MPGTFLFGVAGIAAMMIALVMTFDISQLPSFLSSGSSFDASPWLYGLFFIFTCAIIALIFPIIVSKYIVPLLPEGYTPMLKADLAEALSPTESIENIHIGSIGIAKTFLRPVGHADFDGQLLDVQTRGEIIEPGEQIEVTLVQDGRLWVQKHTKNS